MAVFEYRLARSESFKAVRGRVDELMEDEERTHDLALKHEEQISGDGGLQTSFKALRDEMGRLRVSFYGLTAAIIAATITLAATLH